MFTTKIAVRFAETDALRHVNNTVYYVYMEEARRPIFEIFNPGLDSAKWNLIVAHTSCDYLKQLTYGEEIRVDTWVKSIGNKSLTVGHEIYSVTYGHKVAAGEAVLVYFNFEEQRSEAIPDICRSRLMEHLISAT